MNPALYLAVIRWRAQALEIVTAPAGRHRASLVALAYRFLDQWGA